MKTTVYILIIGFFTSFGAFAQEGELVSIDRETQTEYYTRNNDYSVQPDGSFSGNIVAYYEDGKLKETGALESGTKVGTWYKYDSNGNKVGKGSYKDGLKDGDWKVWDGEGNLRIIMNYSEGKRSGEWIFYDAEGNVLQSKNY
jgi:antitoxin component YwqK of YwqJK toxin-antitoxin module